MCRMLKSMFLTAATSRWKQPQLKLPSWSETFCIAYCNQHSIEVGDNDEQRTFAKVTSDT